MTTHRKESAAHLRLYLAEIDELDSWLHPAVPAALPKIVRGAGALTLQRVNVRKLS